MTDPLSFEDVTVRYHREQSPVLRNISLSMKQGEKVALLGLNGSGKTTLLLAAAGLLPFEGKIRVDGILLEKHTLGAVRERIGFLFHPPEDQFLFPRVIDDVAFALARHGVPRKEAHATSRDMLDRLGVTELAEETPFHLSHGQRQRVALAGALVSQPPLLLLDEPSAALDPPGKKSLAHLLAGLHSAMLIATHDIPFVSRVCTRFLVLANSRILLDATDEREAENCLWQATTSND